MDKFNSQYATRKLRETSATSAGPGSANMTAGDGEQYTTRTKKNEIVKKVGDKYAVYPKKGGKRLGTHDSKEKANKQLAAIEISKAQKEGVDKEPKLAAGEAENYVKDKWGWKEAPSIPNRSSDMFDYRELWPDEKLNENYSRFKKETKTRTNEQQLHTAMRLAEKKIREANRILEYTSQLRGELNETRMNKNTQKLMERITRGIAEAYGKMKKIK